MAKDSTATATSVYVSSNNSSSVSVMESGANSSESGAATTHSKHLHSKRASVTRRTSKAIENAVYSHIRAVRTLGRTQINTSEVADSLSLPIADVNRAIDALKRKGVRPL